MGIFSIIAIKIGDSLLLMLPWEPILHEILNLGDIHELHIVHMTIFLPLDDHIGRNTFITHSFRIRFMIFAGLINLITYSGWREAVVALDLDWMYSLAFELLLL